MIPREFWDDGLFANVLVPRDAPQYAAMVTKAENYPGKIMRGREWERFIEPRLFWRMDERGIWVPLEWLR